MVVVLRLAASAAAVAANLIGASRPSVLAELRLADVSRPSASLVGADVKYYLVLS